MSRRDLVKGRIGNVGSSYRRRYLYDCLETLHDLGITGAVVVLCIRLCLPETVTHGFREIRRDKGNFIQESLLLAEQWNYFPLNQTGKFRGALGLESHQYMTSK